MSAPSRAPVFSCVHYFQAPVAQANLGFTVWGRGPERVAERKSSPCVHVLHKREIRHYHVGVQ